MKITVHRGSHQIGGSCIEVSSGATRIILDAGLPLDPDDNAGPLKPGVAGLFEQDGPPIEALFLSHAHADHGGLVSATRAHIRVGVTPGTSKMLLAGSLFARQPDVPRDRQRVMTEGKPVRLGSFRVTALPVDHSVYGAAAFLLEAEGKRVLYTGDLRWHGQKPGMSRALTRIAANPCLDALIIEGTRLGARATEDNVSERAVEDQLLTDFHDAPGLVLAMYSPLNVDRFVTFYRAAKRARRTLVVDPYQAFVLHLIHRQTKVPTPASAADLRVLIPPNFANGYAGRRLRRTRWYQSLPNHTTSLEAVVADPKRFVLLFRPSMTAWACPDGLFPNATAVFSYWPGYLREPRLIDFARQVKASGGTLLQRHASGHAHSEDLRRFVETIRPKLLIPVHTEAPEVWARLWAGTQMKSDGDAIIL